MGSLGCVCLATPMLHSGVKVGSLGCVCLATPMLHSGPRWVRPSTHNRSMPPCPLPPPPSHHTQTPPPPPFNNVQVRVGVWACGRVGGVALALARAPARPRPCARNRQGNRCTHAWLSARSPGPGPAVCAARAVQWLPYSVAVAVESRKHSSPLVTTVTAGAGAGAGAGSFS